MSRPQSRIDCEKKIFLRKKLNEKKKSNMRRCTGYADVDQIQKYEQYLFVQTTYRIKV